MEWVQNWFANIAIKRFAAWIVKAALSVAVAHAAHLGSYGVKFSVDPTTAEAAATAGILEIVHKLEERLKKKEEKKDDEKK